MRWAKLGEVIKARRITDLVLGYPYNMDGSVGFKAKEVDVFAAKLKSAFGLPVHLEGYPPPFDPRLDVIRLAADPGVLEVNVHPSADWRGCVETTRILYEEARLARLGTEKFQLDGRHSGTGCLIGPTRFCSFGPRCANRPGGVFVCSRSQNAIRTEKVARSIRTPLSGDRKSVV
mgnify:CR=1 FL=1